MLWLKSVSILGLQENNRHLPRLLANSNTRSIGRAELVLVAEVVLLKCFKLDAKHKGLVLRHAPSACPGGASSPAEAWWWPRHEA